MSWRRVLFLLAAMVLVVAAAGGSYLAAAGHALNGLRVERVSADELATAMQQDRFFSAYRERTLLVSGTVAAVRNVGSDPIVRFRTATTYQTVCQLSADDRLPRPGEVLTAVTEGAAAHREPSGVLLQNCAVP